MSVLMNVVSICRNRSGLAWASCSCRKRVGSILLGAVIALVSWRSVRGFPEDHAVGRLRVRASPRSGGPSYTTLADTADRFLRQAVSWQAGCHQTGQQDDAAPPASAN